MINTPGLVHFTNSDVERAASYLNVTTSEGTVDELGFGPVLDYFADQLFPWCTEAAILEESILYLIRVCFYKEFGREQRN